MTKFKVGTLVIRTCCPHCGTEFKILKSANGEVVTCSECGNKFVVGGMRKVSTSGTDESKPKERKKKGCFMVVLQYAFGMFLLGLLAVAGMTFIANLDQKTSAPETISIPIIKDSSGMAIGMFGHCIGEWPTGSRVLGKKVNFTIRSRNFTAYNGEFECWRINMSDQVWKLALRIRFNGDPGRSVRESIANDLRAYLVHEGFSLPNREASEVYEIKYVGSNGPVEYYLNVNPFTIYLTISCPAR